MVLTPSRLAIARKRRGFTLTRLAELTGLSTHSLSVYENGHQAPSEDTLLMLAGALDITPDFLAGPDVEEIPPDAVSFRALSKMTARQRDRALSAAGLRCSSTTGSMPASIARCGYSEPDRLRPGIGGWVVRARWGLASGRSLTMLHLLEAHGVRIYSLTAENNELDACSLFLARSPVHLRSTAKSGERGRFDAAQLG